MKVVCRVLSLTSDVKHINEKLEVSGICNMHVEKHDRQAFHGQGGSGLL